MLVMVMVVAAAATIVIVVVELSSIYMCIPIRFFGVNLPKTPPKT